MTDRLLNNRERFDALGKQVGRLGKTFTKDLSDDQAYEAITEAQDAKTLNAVMKWGEEMCTHGIHIQKQRHECWQCWSELGDERK